MKESQVQKKVQEYLQLNGWLVVKIIQCNLNGWPDLQAHKNGITIFIECKAPGKKAAPLQQYRHEKLKQSGFSVYLITDPKEIEHVK